MTQTVHRGSCLCGEVHFEVEGAFEHFICCHCSRCQKGTGSAHGANLFAPGGTLTWVSGEDSVRTFALPSTRHVRGFCSTCGAALPTLQMDGTLVVVPAGSLDEAAPLPSQAHIFCASRASWEDGLSQAPRFDRLPE
ncbi:MAG: GFA family protein [Nannocystaceae bacterium]|nr:GFA family protein [bacterium]